MGASASLVETELSAEVKAEYDRLIQAGTPHDQIEKLLREKFSLPSTVEV